MPHSDEPVRFALVLAASTAPAEAASLAALSIVRYTTRSLTMVPQYLPSGSYTFPFWS